jgi:hypothetical protein
VARLPKPFLLSFPPFPGADDRVGDEEARAISKRSMADLPWTPRWSGEDRPPEVREDRRSQHVVEVVFRRVAEHPDEIRSETCEALGIEASTLSEALAELGPDSGRGLIESGGRIGNYRFSRLTARGRAVAREKGLKLFPGNVSPAHQWMVRQCLKSLGRSYRVRILDRKHGVNGKRPDGLFGVGDHTIAVQVCASSGNYGREARALKSLAEASGVDVAVLVGSTGRHAKAVRAALKDLLGEDTCGHIAVCDATQVLNRKFDWKTVIGEA